MVQIFRICKFILFLTLSVSAQAIFNEGFEGSTSSWTVSGGGWVFKAPSSTSGTTIVPEGTKFAGTIIDGQYTDNAAYYLTSPQITIPSTGIFVLNFREYLSTESNYDYAYLQIEQNGSNNWVNLRSTSTSNTSWQLREFDLNSYRGSTIRLRFYFDSDGSSTYYGWYIDDIKILSIPSYNLTVQSQPNGTTTPSGLISVRSGYATSITATPSTNYRFAKWSKVSGSPTFADSLAASTTVTISSDATIMANFKPCSVYTITPTATSYNYTQHYYQTSPSDGVRLKFTATIAGSYSVNLQNIDVHSNYLYYYGTDATFSSAISSPSNGSSISTAFYANAGETHYFRVYTSSSSYYTYNFNINFSSALSLRVSNDGNGTTSPSGLTGAVSGVSTNINATAASGYRFKNWTVVSGSASITDPASTSTTVSTTADAEIRATFKPCSVYTIESAARQYNYTQHYYSSSPSTGVRFKFTATTTGSYSVTIQNVESHSNYLYYYGQDANFSTAVNSTSNSSSVTMAFYANAGETHYFRVYTSSSSYYTYNFNINYSSALSLSISNDGHGTTSPTGIIGVVSGASTSITATSSTGYRFQSWSVVSGNPTIANPATTPTTVTTTSNAAIKATFKPCTMYTISSTPQQYNYQQHYYQSVSTGVRFKFTAPISGTFIMTTQNVESHTNYIYYYGRDSLFSSTVRSKTNSSTDTLTFTASAGETHYFRVYVSSSSYYNYNFKINCSTPITLTVLKSGSGWTSPSGNYGVIPNYATNISAVPAGGYLFQNWTVIRGNPVIANPNSAATTVTVSNDSNTICANFQINPNTRPNVQISDITISSHPDICLTASVTDSAGRSITGLDTNNFILTQDSDTLDYQLTTVSNVSGVSVALVIDISGSMSEELADAKNAALQYVSSMGPMDRCAIVSFDDIVTVEQPITSDKSLLTAAINRLAYDGTTAILNGAQTGVQQLLQETNSRAVIIYSDGSDNASTISIATVINSARQNSAVIYSIGLGTSADRSVLGQLADSTGGYYTYSPDAAGLAAIYAQIKSDVQAQYILCYRSPDIIFNGDTHQVVLSAILNNHTDKDTVYWNENNNPPQITLTAQTNAMIGVSQTQNQPLTISADVTDDGSISLVRLFYRRSSITAGAYTEVVMTHPSGTLYQYTLPANLVLSPGIDFYILATDNYHLIGRSPNILAPETQPWVIPINNDVPVITQTPITCLPQGVNSTLSATITDHDGTFIAFLYYKKGNETFYTIDTMNETSVNNYSSTIPGAMITTDGIDYYFRAVDNVGASVRSPGTSFIHLGLCNASNPIANAGPDQTISVGSNNCTISASLNGTGSIGNNLTYSWTGPFSGTVTGATPTVNLPLGLNKIILSVTSASSGLSDLDTVLITVRDTYAPVPNQTSLPDITGQCSATVTVPTATDNCGGIINATTSSPTTFTTQGIFNVEWVYTDPSGNTTKQTQKVIIKDNAPPVPVVASLPELRGTCAVTVTTIPTAYDSCTAKLITGVTSSPLTYDHSGQYTIVWNYTDDYFNRSSQNQSVVIEDLIAPVADKPDLPVVRGECTVTVTDTPTATDNCSNVIKVTTLDPLTYATQGTYTITWRFSDLSGNTSLQPQQVIVDDITPPIPEKNQLDTLYSSCSIVLTAPFAVDNCSGRIQGTTTSPLTINHQGSHIITWSYNDGNGNTSTQDQTIIIKDTISPVFNTPVDKSANLKSMLSSITVQVDPAVAIDNCTPVSIQGVRSDGQPLGAGYSEGVTRITWTACDTNNNCSTILQNVTVIRNKAPVLQIPSDTFLNEGEILKLSFAVSDTDGTIPKLFIDSLTFPFVFKDSGNGSATLSLRPGCTNHGTYTIKVHASDNIDTTNKELAITIKDINYPPEFDTTQYYKAHEMVQFSTLIRVYDCDNPNPKIRIVNAPKGASFIDNNNGTGTFIWTPDADDNGFYMVIFEAQDDMTAVRDTIIIEITDVNAYTPDLTISTVDTTIPVKLPVVIVASAKDRDGTPTYLQASGIPSGAFFEADNAGNAVFRWTPTDTGTYNFNIIAIDGADTNSKVIKQVSLKVSNVNVTGPNFLSIDDFIIDQNQQLLITLEARDPDGTVPVIHLRNSNPADLSFSDNGNGTATISWIPPCNLSGIFHFTATAFDQSFIDSISFAVTVRDINCQPIIFRTSDITAQTGEMVRIPIKAYDPDGDTIVPTLSVISTLPGHTFTTSDNGTALFRWQAIYESGSYPVTFYATDGMLTDSFTLYIHINKTGSVHLSCSPSGSTIYTMPSGCYSGEYIGTDSAHFSAPPGVYHFEIRKESYRSEQFSLKIAADSTFERKFTLTPSIPLMTLSPDSLPIGIDSSNAYGPFAFADLNRDGFIDYSVLGQHGIRVFLGLDSTGLKFNSKAFELTDTLPVSTILHYELVDWNNDKTLDCIYSNISGNLMVTNFKTGMSETILSLPGSKLYASVIDFDNDHKKDLAILNDGAGLIIYHNQGTDIEPVFTEYHPVTITDGSISASLHGPFSFIDFDGNGILELLIMYDHTPALFNISKDFTELSYIDDLNCAGKRLTADSLKISQIGSSFNLPHIIFKNPKKTLIFGTHLLGDVNKDKKVDIRDISKISKLWEITESDSLWDPQCNLKLSPSGQEKIDIRDISKVSKCWELHQ